MTKQLGWLVCLLALVIACSREETATGEGRSAPVGRDAKIAPWLAERATPLNVRVAEASPDNSETRRIGVGGGQIRLDAGEHRIVLEIPPEALPSSQEITLAVVEVEDLPFARGAAVAVRVGPAETIVRRPLLLTVQPEGGGADAPFAAFAIRDGQMNLYPAAQVQEGAGSRARTEIRMLIGGAGSYGIAPASPAELAETATRVPADPLSRLEQRMAIAFMPPAQSASLTTFVAFLQVATQPVSPPTPAPSAWLQELLESIRDTYNDAVLPSFDALPKDDCLSAALWNAIREFSRWKALNQLLLPVQPDPALNHDSLVLQRQNLLRARGFSDAQIEEIDREIEKYRQNFEEFESRMMARIIEELRRAFQNLHRCCMTQKPLQYHLDTMVSILRAAALYGEEDLVPDSWKPLNECACRIASAAKGGPDAFFGTITQIETLKIDETWKSPGGGGRMQRTESRKRDLSYEMTIHLLRPLGGNNMFAETSVRGTDQQWHLQSDDYGSCMVEREGWEDAEGRAEDAQAVALHLRPKKGTYTVSFRTFPAEGFASIRQRNETSGSGCNVFAAKNNSDRTSWQRAGISGSNVDIVDQPYDEEAMFLRGSRNLEGRRIDGARTSVELKWDLRRCGK